MTTKAWLRKHTSSLTGKRIALFGSTGGLGQALARHILALGGALIMIDRNQEKAATAEARLCAEFPDAQICRLSADLSDMDTVRALCDELMTAPPDAIIHNAGAYHIPRKICKTGYDNIFEINFAAPYYVTRTLLPLLRAKGSRIVAVGSIAHNYAKTDPADVDFRSRTKHSLAYGNAKRHLTYALFALQKEYPDLHVAVTHPGISSTGITAHYPKWIYAIIKYPMKWIFMKPRRASLSILYGLFTDTEPNEWIGPSLFSVWGSPKKKPLRTADTEETVRIAAVAEEIYKKRA